MVAIASTIEDAMVQFGILIRSCPYRFSGQWFVAKTGGNEFVAYRTKKAAVKNSVLDHLWTIGRRCSTVSG